VQRFIAFAYQLLQAAGSEIGRLDFVHAIYNMVKKETAADETNLFFYHDRKLYHFMLTETDQPALRRCDTDPRIWAEGIWAHDGLSFRWLPDFFATYCDPEGLKDWSVIREGNCHSFELKQTENTAGRFQSILMVPFVYQQDKMGLVLLKMKKQSYFDQQSILLYQGLGHALSEAFEHQHAHHSCKERVKELSCLYEISRLSGLPNLKKEEILSRIAMMLPSAMQYPEIATARISIDHQVFTSVPFHESDIRLSSEIISEKMPRGSLEVFYLAGQNDFYDDIFLVEEEKLVHTVSNQIALLVERKESEELSQRLQAQLLHADRLATIGQLSAGVAHEINEPLGSILGFSQLVRENSADEATQKDVEKIIKATLHAREIIRKLMLFSRQMPLRKSKINVNKIIEEGLFFLENRFMKNAIRLVRKYDTDLPEIVADPGQIHQILVNLAVNSMHAMPDGGTFTIETHATAREIIIRVSDTGTGMSDEVRQKIFLPFFTTKRVQEGTGLGLSVVHGIVVSHGGRIEVSSRQGEGTVFSISLPVEEFGKENLHE
jgi:signal transduction histidine kinase